MKIIKKIVSLTFATLSLMLLFVPWVKFTEEREIYEYLKKTCEDEQIRVEKVSDIKREYKNILKNDLQELAQAVKENDVKINVTKMLRIYDAVIDFEVTPNELDYACSNVSPIIRKLSRISEEEDLTGENSEAVETMKQLSLVMSAYHYLYLATFIVFVLSVITIIIDKYRINKPLYFLVRILMAGAFIYSVFAHNDRIGTYEGTEAFTMTFTLWPIIATLLAIPDRAYLWIIDKIAANSKLKPALINAANKANQETHILSSDSFKKVFVKSAEGWTCPDCGTVNSTDDKFCSGCGKANPNVMNCPKCGKALTDQEKFCPDCGTVIQWPATDLTCPVCGAKNPLDSTFCENCGSKLQ